MISTMIQGNYGSQKNKALNYLGGHFPLENLGQFAVELRDHFKMELVGHFEWNIHL